MSRIEGQAGHVTPGDALALLVLRLEYVARYAQALKVAFMVGAALCQWCDVVDFLCGGDVPLRHAHRTQGVVP